MGIEGIVLEDHGDVPILGRNAVDHLAADGDLPFGDLLQAGDHAQGGGLAAAGGANQDDELLILDLHAEVLHRHHGLVVDLFHMIEGNFCHGLLPVLRIDFFPVALPGAIQPGGHLLSSSVRQVRMTSRMASTSSVTAGVRPKSSISASSSAR